MKPTVEVIVSADGGISIDAAGFKGPGCERATEMLEQALGVIVLRDRKPEYRASARTAARQRVGS